MSDTTANHEQQTIATENEVIPSPPDAPKKASRPKKPLIVPTKVQKKLDTLQAKIDKLSADNKALKDHISHLKTSNTRIRRIPKVEQSSA